MDESTRKTSIRSYPAKKYVYWLIYLILFMAIVTISFLYWQSNEFRRTELLANKYHLYTMHNCTRIKEEALHILVYIYEPLAQNKLKKKLFDGNETDLNVSFYLIRERLEKIKELQQHYKYHEYENALKNAENIADMIISMKNNIDYTSIADVNKVMKLLSALLARFEQLRRLHSIAYTRYTSELLSKKLQAPRDILIFLFSLGTLGFLIITRILKTIRSTEEELYKHRQHLQVLVEERTAELKRINETLRNEVTERKRVEGELLKQQYFLSKAQQIGKIGTWELDIRENILVWTEENYRMFGLPIGKPLTYETFLDCVHPDDREYVDREWKAAFKKKPYDIEHRLLMSNGSIKWVREKAELEFDEQGNCLRGTGFTQDITARKEAEEEIKLLAKFPSENPNPVLRIDHIGSILYKNDAVNILLKENGLSEKDVFTMLPDNLITLINKALEKNKALHGLEVNLGENVYSYSISPITDNQYVNLYAMDITERKKAEEEIKTRQKEIEEINASLEERVQEEVEKSRQKDYIMIKQSRLAAMGEMIRFITHQWGQPLWALQLLFHNIEDSIEDSGIKQEDTDELIANGFTLVKRMFSTMDDFKTFFQADKKKVNFSLNKSIKDTLSMIGASFKYSNIPIRLNEKEELMVSGFPNEFSQVILNILKNAKDAILEKGVDGEIKIDLLCKDDTAIVRIKDNGGGIPEEVLDRIFDSYFTTKKEDKGTGIGLYLSKVIIEDRMKGRINVKNTQKGAEFEINLPIVRSL